MDFIVTWATFENRIFSIFRRVVCTRKKICSIVYFMRFFKICPSANNLEEFELINVRIVHWCAVGWFLRLAQTNSYSPLSSVKWWSEMGIFLVLFSPEIWSTVGWWWRWEPISTPTRTASPCPWPCTWPVSTSRWRSMRSDKNRNRPQKYSCEKRLDAGNILFYQALAAATINAAHSIGRGASHGSLQVTSLTFF